MKNLKKILLTCFTAASFVVFMGCDKSENNGPGTSGMRVSMTDAPGDYDEVNIEVIDVKIKNSSDTGEGGWVSIGNITPGVYNLLDLTGGVTQLLADNDVPSGFLGQIRLILGDDNTVVKDGVTYPLNTPSAQQSGLKVQVNQTLVNGIDYNFLLDFDVNNSVVVEAGSSGNYNLHPVIRVTSVEAISGSITGTLPVSVGQVMASVTSGSETISAYTNDEGIFVLHGLPSGTYTITLTPDIATGINPLVIENVVVVNGEITNMGAISL